MELHAMQKTAEISGKNGLIQHAIKTHKTLTRNPYIQIKLTELEREYRQCRIRTLNQSDQKQRKKDHSQSQKQSNKTHETYITQTFSKEPNKQNGNRYSEIGSAL